MDLCKKIIQNLLLAEEPLLRDFLLKNFSEATQLPVKHKPTLPSRAPVEEILFRHCCTKYQGIWLTGSLCNTTRNGEEQRRSVFQWHKQE